MATPTFSPPRAPSIGTERGNKPKLLKTEFGDGYTQVTADGLNHNRQELRLTWEFLKPWDADEIHDFLNERAGYQPFYYTPEYDAGHNSNGTSTPRDAKRWRCEEWNESIEQGGFRTLTATFIQDFSLAD